MAVVGYARTSTEDQVAGLEDQLRELKAAGCTKVFREHGSGVDAGRPELAKALDYVRDGDTFVVTKPDRLARSVTNLIGMVNELRTRDVEVQILSMKLDTGTPTGKLMLTVIGAVAEFERELMLERQRAGIARAKAEGKYRGRAPTARAKAQEVMALIEKGLSPGQAAREAGIGRASAYRIFADARAQG